MQVCAQELLTTMIEVIRINNEAALLIEKADYKKSIQILRLANRILVAEMERSHVVNINDNGEAKPVIYFDCTGNNRRSVEGWKMSQHSLSCFCDSEIRFSSRPRCGTDKKFSYEDMENESFISKRPIHISCLPPERGDYFLSVIILFNLALAYQLLAWNLKPDNVIRKRLVRESLYFYQCAFIMKSKGLLHLDTSFVLAMVNNTAHLQLEMGQESRAKKLQDLILSTLMMVVDNNLSSSIDDMDGFMATATQSMKLKDKAVTAWAA